MAATHVQLAAQIKAQIAASPAKCATLVALALVLVICVAVQVAHDPSSADAAVVVPVKPNSPLPMPSQVIGGSPLTRQEPLRDMPADLPGDLVRDLFAVASDIYPPIVTPNEENQTGLSADNQEDEDQEPTLEATYQRRGHGQEPVAIINGTLVHVNDRIGRYVLEAIESRHVVLRDGQSRIILTMR